MGLGGGAGHEVLTSASEAIGRVLGFTLQCVGGSREYEMFLKLPSLRVGKCIYLEGGETQREGQEDSP